MTEIKPKVQGIVEQINIKGQTEGECGLPKRSAGRVAVTRNGLRGDYNNYRQEKLDGDPDSAVLIFPAETLEDLNREGWPVEAGHLGENLTTRNLRYDDLFPSRRLKVGRQVELEVSRACEPCRNLSRLPYVGEEKQKIFIQTMLGRRGWYARVLREGEIRQGDPITLLV